MILGYFVSIYSSKRYVASMTHKLYLLKKIPNIDNVKRNISLFSKNKLNNCCAEFHPKHYFFTTRCVSKEQKQKSVDRELALDVYKWVEK
jgi:hypothetical protein